MNMKERITNPGGKNHAGETVLDTPEASKRRQDSFSTDARLVPIWNHTALHSIVQLKGKTRGS
jgi:hypothetical protein